MGLLTLSGRIFVHRHHGNTLLGILAIFLAVVTVYLLVTVGEVAFERMGFSSFEYILILIGTLIGSTINIPVARAHSTEPLLEVEEVRVFGLYYRLPRLSHREVSTIISVNVGGAVIPVLVSTYLLAGHTGLLIEAAAGSILTAILVHVMARKVKGVGIVTPALLPPIAAALIAYLLAPGSPAIVAYVSGTMGALVGADLTNLGGITKLGAPVVSIGGAGTFDGVFLTGLVAVLLVPFL
jgi:uncharacterized membrane protein